MIEVGDFFIIKFSKNCLYKDKEYSVEGFSKSGNLIYYYDRRTNIKCKCTICSGKFKREEFGSYVKSYIKLEHVILTATKLARERDLKLKRLFKYV